MLPKAVTSPQSRKEIVMKFKAWFVNELGHKFSKEFESGEEMERFIERSSEVGTKLTSFINCEIQDEKRS